MCAAIAVFSVLTPCALAQERRGSIEGFVRDVTGAVVAGASVEVRGAALVGAEVTVTDAAGAYRFPSLPPGVYRVTVELQGFQTVQQDSVNVLVGQTTPLELTMRVATLAETVTVSGASPVIDTTSANVAVNLGEQLLQSTPGGRDIWALVDYKVPSLLITRPDVGGTAGVPRRVRDRRSAVAQWSRRTDIKRRVASRRSWLPSPG